MKEEKIINNEVYLLQTFVIDPKQEPLRIDKFLMGRLENVTRNRIQKAIEEGWVLVNDKKIKSNHKVKYGQTITVSWKKQKTEGGPIAQKIDLDIRYEDDDIIILHKPVGLVVHPGIGNADGTLVNGLVHYLKGLPIVNGNERPGIVHRIDKNTSGLMVVAKNEEAMSHIAKQFFDHTIERRYQALVWGDFEEDEGTIVGNIDRHPKYRRLRHVYPDGERGKHAITHYKVLQRFGYVTLVECKLETGRTHQIRVHFKHIGHTLFGDISYGGDKILKGTVFSKYKHFILNCFKILPRQALHAKSLGLIHPTTNKFMQFDSSLPEDIEAVIDRWKRYTEGRLKF
ncbi:MAG: RluA family pseudouridine synthase [Saprospiraceae bacterium]|nr:RluA family pseudouridine synthase [Saprospiraceae bacterium]